jgi:hypothetical protein
MRTTVTLDDDIAARLKERAQELGVPFKEVLNATLRAGLGGQEQPRPYTQRTASLGLRPGIDLDRASQLADDLQDRETIRKLELRK